MELYSARKERLSEDEARLAMEQVEAGEAYLQDDVLTVRHEAVEAVEEVSHYETVREYPNGGRDVRRVIDVPGVEAAEAWEETIPIKTVIPYTPEELAERQRQREEQERREREAREAAEREKQEREEAVRREEQAKEQRLVDIEDALIELAGMLAAMQEGE